MTPMAKNGPAPLIDEREFIPQTLEEARALGAALMQVGAGRGRTASAVWDLTHLDELDRKDGAVQARLSYHRRFLALVGAPPWDRGPSEDKGASLSSTGAKTKGRRFGRSRKIGRPQRAISPIAEAAYWTEIRAA